MEKPHDGERPPSLFRRLMGAMRTTSSARSSQSLDSEHSDGEGGDGGHSIDKGHSWQRSFSFLRRGSSKRKKDGQHSETSSVQAHQNQQNSGYINTGFVNDDHTNILPSNVQVQHAGSDSSRGGAHSPSLPATPLSPHSPGLTPPRSPFGSPRASPIPSRRSPSPRRVDVGFASAVTNLVEKAHTIAEHERRRHYGIRHDDSLSVPSSPQLMRGRSRTRSRAPLQPQPPVSASPSPTPLQHRGSNIYSRSTSLEARSRSPSPNPNPNLSPQHEYYGSTNLIDRSRSPSPAPSPPKRVGRKLPPVPTKPSSLNLAQPKLKENMPRMMPSPTVPQPPKSPGNINFPKVNASPTHVPKPNVAPQTHHVPPPGRLGRPEPYSPTERNHLNKMNEPHAQTLPAHLRTTGLRGDRSWSRERGVEHRSNSGSNRGSPDVRNTSDRTRILANQFDEGGSGRARPRSGATLPNGFKPKGRKAEKYEMRSDSNVPLQRDSDDDDDDWC